MSLWNQHCTQGMLCQLHSSDSSGGLHAEMASSEQVFENELFLCFKFQLLQLFLWGSSERWDLTPRRSVYPATPHTAHSTEPGIPLGQNSDAFKILLSYYEGALSGAPSLFSTEGVRATGWENQLTATRLRDPMKLSANSGTSCMQADSIDSTQRSKGSQP